MRIKELESIWQIWMKWQSGLENVTLFLSVACRTLSFIKRIHYLHSFKFGWIEYLTVSDNSSLHQFNLSLDLSFFIHLTYGQLGNYWYLQQLT